MPQEEIILEMLKVLVSIRRTLVQVHMEVALEKYFSASVRNTEWSIEHIDDLLRKIGPHIPEDVRKRYLEATRPSFLPKDYTFPT